MKLVLKTTLSLAALTAGSQALAQYSSPPPSTPQLPTAAGAGVEKASTYQPKASASARKELAELQAAVKAKDAANIPAKVAAAKAKARTKDDHYVIAQLQLRAAADAGDNAAILTALDAIIATGVLPPSDQLRVYNNLGKLRYNAKQFDAAAAAFEQVLRIDSNNVEATVMLAESRNSQGRPAEAVALLRKAIAAKTASGQKAEESWYKRAVALGFNAGLPVSVPAARDWVAVYPTPTNWRDAIRVYQSTSKLGDADLIDSMRLAHATGGLKGESDYFRFANVLVTRGYPGEAKAVLEQGFAAKSIDKARPTFTQIYALASTKALVDRASLAATAKAALASPTARPAMTTADAFYGYGDYAQAASLYRAALTKGGVDKDLAQLRLGMALARAGDRAGATAALNAVGGAQSEIAKFWLTYLATRG
ncbi:MAG TPA: tetratricopeptide repeat protein [Sphingomicrobium sp.]|nr:tetratricopeptide repeat protein [Sphingomicrobium sp.]